MLDPCAAPHVTPPLICVVGLSGAGESAHMARLAVALEAGGRKPVGMTTWDVLSEPRFRGRPGFSRADEVAVYSELLDPTARALLMLHFVQQALALARTRDADVVLCAGYWYWHYARAVAQGGDAALLRTMTAAFPRPALTLLLEGEASNRTHATEPAGESRSLVVRELRALSRKLRWMSVWPDTEIAHEARTVEAAIARGRLRQ